jgi:aspartokinase/homoserine dehydrogenase 1
MSAGNKQIAVRIIRKFVEMGFNIKHPSFDGTNRFQVGLIGTGVVGGELFRQLEDTKSTLIKNKLDVKITAVSCLKDGQPWMLLSDKGLTIAEYEAALKDKSKGESSNLDKLGTFVKSVHKNAVVFDCTASEQVSDKYEPWLKSGLNVITPNKKVGSGPLDRYRRCKQAAEGAGSQWGYETTVGAGLPIINVLRNDLLDTGDRIKKIEGIFSGTLSYIFNTFRPGLSFSSVIADAKDKGFTEPDPRDDLSGWACTPALLRLAPLRICHRLPWCNICSPALFN